MSCWVLVILFFWTHVAQYWSTNNLSIYKCVSQILQSCKAVHRFKHIKILQGPTILIAKSSLREDKVREERGVKGRLPSEDIPFKEITFIYTLNDVAPPPPRPGFLSLLLQQHTYWELEEGYRQTCNCFSFLLRASSRQCKRSRWLEMPAPLLHPSFPKQTNRSENAELDMKLS